MTSTTMPELMMMSGPSNGVNNSNNQHNFNQSSSQSPTLSSTSSSTTGSRDHPHHHYHQHRSSTSPSSSSIPAHISSTASPLSSGTLHFFNEVSAQVAAQELMGKQQQQEQQNGGAAGGGDDDKIDGDPDHKNGKSRNWYQCRRCRYHGQFVFLAGGHYQVCPYRKCSCQACRYVSKDTERAGQRMREWRKTKKERQAPHKRPHNPRIPAPGHPSCPPSPPHEPKASGLTVVGGLRSPLKVSVSPPSSSTMNNSLRQHGLAQSPPPYPPPLSTNPSATTTSSSSPQTAAAPVTPPASAPQIPFHYPPLPTQPSSLHSSGPSSLQLASLAAERQLFLQNVLAHSNRPGGLVMAAATEKLGLDESIMSLARAGASDSTQHPFNSRKFSSQTPLSLPTIVRPNTPGSIPTTDIAENTNDRTARRSYHDHLNNAHQIPFHHHQTQLNSSPHPLEPYPTKLGVYSPTQQHHNSSLLSLPPHQSQQNLFVERYIKQERETGGEGSAEEQTTETMICHKTTAVVRNDRSNQHQQQHRRHHQHSNSTSPPALIHHPHTTIRHPTLLIRQQLNEEDQPPPNKTAKLKKADNSEIGTRMESTAFGFSSVSPGFGGRKGSAGEHSCSSGTLSPPEPTYSMTNAENVMDLIKMAQNIDCTFSFKSDGEVNFKSETGSDQKCLRLIDEGSVIRVIVESVARKSDNEWPKLAGGWDQFLMFVKTLLVTLVQICSPGLIQPINQ